MPAHDGLALERAPLQSGFPPEGATAVDVLDVGLDVVSGDVIVDGLAAGAEYVVVDDAEAAGGEFRV